VGDGPRLPEAGKRRAPADPNAGSYERLRPLDRNGGGQIGQMRRAPRPVPPPWPAKIADNPKAHHRTDRLPSNVPAWFKEYDTDGDGQIALYEWKARGHSVEDFKKADLNGDGFITLKELMRAGLFEPSPVASRPAPRAAAARVPQSARQLRAQVGEFFYLEVTGTTGGAVWGTDVYTDTSHIATAAVHAGVLSVGEKGFVKVTILPGQESYEGSTSNGVTTQSFGAFGGSYRIERPW
jgi:hypothetical protein